MASIEKRGDSYRITVSMGTDIYGKKITQKTTFRPDSSLSPKKQEKAVQAFAADFEAKVLNGKIMDGRRISLKDFSDRWFEEYANQRLQPRTLESYHDEMNRILPKMGHYKLTELKPANLNAFFSEMAKDGARADGKPGGLSKSTIAKTKAVLGSILSTAYDWEIIESNPMSKVHIEAKPTEETVKFFNVEQAADFLDFIERPYQIATKGHGRVDDTGKAYTVAAYTSEKEMQEQMKILLILAIYTGLRKGELLALTWNDIDFDNDTISVSKAVTVVKGQQFVKCPKTKTSRRTVSIPHSLTVRIKKLKVDRLRYQLSIGDYWQGADWLFIQDDGRQMHYGSPAHAFRDALLRYNQSVPNEQQLPLIPFHGLRHTSATLLIGNNQDIRSVSARLGHSRTSVTLDIYSHALQSADKKAADMLEELLVKQA